MNAASRQGFLRNSTGLRRCLALLIAASMLGPATALAAGAALTEASAKQRMDAQKKYEDASALFKKGQFEAALSLAQASYDVVASPNSRLLVAYALRELGRRTEAYAEADAAAAEAEQAALKDSYYLQTVKAAQSEMLELRPSVALLTVQIQGAPPETSLYVAGQRLPKERWGRPSAIEPGSVEVRLEQPSGEQMRRDVSVAIGHGETAVFDLRPKPMAPFVAHDEQATSWRAMRVGAYVAGGVGLAGAAAFGVFGTLNNTKFDDLQAACPSGRCPSRYAGDIDAGRRYQTLANVGLAVGIVGVATGATLFVLSREPASPSVALGPGSISIEGTF